MMAMMKKVKKLYNYYRYYGLKLLLLKVIRKPEKVMFDYAKWRSKYCVTPEELMVQQKMGGSVKVSLIVPAYNTPENFLKEMIDSVQRQSYANWELCIADGSKLDAVERIVSKYSADDARIKYKSICPHVC